MLNEFLHNPPPKTRNDKIYSVYYNIGTQQLQLSARKRRSKYRRQWYPAERRFFTSLFVAAKSPSSVSSKKSSRALNWNLPYTMTCTPVHRYSRSLRFFRSSLTVIPAMPVVLARLHADDGAVSTSAILAHAQLFGNCLGDGDIDAGEFVPVLILIGGMRHWLP